jgi:Protein of unknown function (DUF4199)
MEKKQIHIPYGFITGLAMVIVGLIIYLAGAAFKPGMQYVSYIPFLVGILLNGIAYSKANDGYVTFGNVFGSCFKASMIVTIVIVAWSLASMAIFPEMKEKALTIAREEMAKNPKMTDDTIDAAINMTKKYWNVFLIAGAIFGTLFYGALFSLIGALVAKKKDAPPTVGNF